MPTKTLLIISTLFWVCGMSFGETVAMRGGQKSMKTRVHLSKGERIDIIASGSIKMGLLTGWNGPEGSSLKWIWKRFEDVPAGALMGCIKNPDGETYFFFIGTEKTIKVPFDGTLYFMINEMIFGDNTGMFEIEIERHAINELKYKMFDFY